MAIIVKDSGTKDFEPAPQGLFPAVLCDVVDLGMVDTQYGKRHMVRLAWQLDGNEAGIRDDGKPWLVTRQFGASLNEKGRLRPFLETWRGQKFTDEELTGFDLEKLIGINCQLQVLREQSSDGKVWANVSAALKAMKGMAHIPIREYIRVKDRDGASAPSEADDDPGF